MSENIKTFNLDPDSQYQDAVHKDGSPVLNSEVVDYVNEFSGLIHEAIRSGVYASPAPSGQMHCTILEALIMGLLQMPYEKGDLPIDHTKFETQSLVAEVIFASVKGHIEDWRDEDLKTMKAEGRG